MAKRTKKLKDNETVQVGVTEFNDVEFVQIRVFYTDDEGELRPGKNGVSLPLDPDLLRKIAKKLNRVADKLEG